MIYWLTWLSSWMTSLGYWIRPYDMMLDARRWRWQESGCLRSHRFVRDVLNQEMPNWWR